MPDDTLSPLSNVLTIDDERIKTHLDRVVRGSVEETLNRGHVQGDPRRVRTLWQRAKRLSECSRSCAACASPEPPSSQKRGRRDARILLLSGRALAADSHQQSARAHPARDPTPHPCRRCIPRRSIRAQSGRGQAAPHRRHGVVDQEIPEHRATEGPADESRSHPRLSQCRAPLSPNQSAKNSGHFRMLNASALSLILTLG
jgi:hypothetical protein